ncbi:MAG: hypothetical protein HC803_09580 [Saprospiraceae bacterium]|nr:hypothetical protein [Saprospiraceae bacterium]
MNIEQLLAPDMMHALGWALIHSLWQGAIIAVLLGVLVLVFRKASSTFRYRLSLASLFLVFVFFIGTFITVYQTNSTTATENIFIDENDILYDALLAENEVITTETENFTTVYIDYFNTHLPFIVTLWFLGMVVFSLRFLGGLALTQRLRHHQNSPMSFEMEEVLMDIQNV